MALPCETSFLSGYTPDRSRGSEGFPASGAGKAPVKKFDSVQIWCYCSVQACIPFAAKVIAVADTYSAITMRRSYKSPKTHEEAIEIMKKVAGTQLDEKLVEVFLEIPREKLQACVPEGVEV